MQIEDIDINIQQTEFLKCLNKLIFKEKEQFQGLKIKRNVMYERRNEKKQNSSSTLVKPHKLIN